LFFTGEKLLESRIVANQVPHHIDLQVLNRNVKTYQGESNRRGVFTARVPRRACTSARPVIK
jgi:hypothetical protein